MARLIACLVFVGIMVANTILGVMARGETAIDFMPWIAVGFAGGLLAATLTDKK